MKFFHESIKMNKNYFCKTDVAIISVLYEAQSWWAVNKEGFLKILYLVIINPISHIGLTLIYFIYFRGLDFDKLINLIFLISNLRTLSTWRSTRESEFMKEGHLRHSDGNFMISRLV